MARVSICFSASGHLEGAVCLENVLCLATLVATGELTPDSNVRDAEYIWEKQYNNDCDKCPHCKVCLAMIINE
jgi:hypothetical protein